MSPVRIIRQYLTNACRSRNNCDLRFILRDGVSVAHKIIILPVLADMSEVFCNACIDNHEEIVIVLPDINKEHFDEARDFLYMFGDGSKIARILGANEFSETSQKNELNVRNQNIDHDNDNHGNIDISQEMVEDNHIESEVTRDPDVKKELNPMEIESFSNIDADDDIIRIENYINKNSIETEMKDIEQTENITKTANFDKSKIGDIIGIKNVIEKNNIEIVMIENEIAESITKATNFDKSKTRETDIIETDDGKKDICDLKSSRKDNSFKTYNCKKCAFVGKDKYALGNHKYLKHSGQKNCNDCDFVTSSPYAFRRHTAKYHGEGLPHHSCDGCEYKTNSKTNLKTHWLNKHEGLRYQCEKCEYLAISKYNLKLHHDSYHLGIRYSCDKCGKQQRTISNLNKHKREKHGELTYKQSRQISYNQQRIFVDR